jgi:hypothetical protein
MAINGFRRLAALLRRLEVHAGQRAYYFKVAKLLRSDIHQKVFEAGVVAIEVLHGILHGRRELAVRAAELFKQHFSESWIGVADINSAHQFFNDDTGPRPSELDDAIYSSRAKH